MHVGGGGRLERGETRSRASRAFPSRDVRRRWRLLSIARRLGSRRGRCTGGLGLVSTNAVLDSARSELVERGVEATAIDDLRRATGLSVGSLYHRFGSKEGLAAAVYAEALGDYQAAAIESLRANPEAEGGVRALVECQLAWHEANTGPGALPARERWARAARTRARAGGRAYERRLHRGGGALVAHARRLRRLARPAVRPRLRALAGGGAGVLPALARGRDARLR